MKLGRIALCIIVLQLCACGPLQPASLQGPERGETVLEFPAGHDLMAGVGRERITPKGNVWLGGYYPGRKSAGVHDDLEVRALALQDADGKISVLVTLDLMGFFYDDVVRLREAVNIPHGEIFVMSSHTHSGPDTVGFYGPSLFKVPLLNGRDEGYIDFVIAQSEKAIAQALGNLVPVSLHHGSGETELIQSKVEPVADHEISVLLFKGVDTGKTVATLVNFACSPATLLRENALVSSDFIGPLRTVLDQQLGTTTLFVNGAMGRVTYHWRFRDYQGYARTDAFGRAMAAEAYSISELAGEVAGKKSMHHGRQVIHIPLENAHFGLLALLGFIPRSGIAISGRVETEVNILQIGKITIAMVPGEIVPELGLEMKRMFGPHTQVWSLANDALGYIVSEEKFHSDHRQYRYARSVSVGPLAGPLIMDAVAKIWLELPRP